MDTDFDSVCAALVFVCVHLRSSVVYMDWIRVLQHSDTPIDSKNCPDSNLPVFRDEK
jgi:hypothetical protein